MRMMKNNKNETIMVIGIDHGYGNMKTANRCFPSGVARYDKEPIFQNIAMRYSTGMRENAVINLFQKINFRKSSVPS